MIRRILVLAGLFSLAAISRSDLSASANTLDAADTPDPFYSPVGPYPENS